MGQRDQSSTLKAISRPSRSLDNQGCFLGPEIDPEQTEQTCREALGARHQPSSNHTKASNPETKKLSGTKRTV